MVFKNIKSHVKLITISFLTILILGLFIFIIIPSPIAKAKEETPNQGYDISFSLENDLVESSDKLMAEIILKMPEEVSTLVDLTFIILTNTGREVYKEKVSANITTDVIMSKSFKGLDLSRGKYTLVLDVYNNDLFEEFKQEFKIGRDRKQITGEVVAYVGDVEKWYFFGFLSVILIVLLIWYNIFKKEERNWERLFKKGKR